MIFPFINLFPVPLLTINVKTGLQNSNLLKHVFGRLITHWFLNDLLKKQRKQIYLFPKFKREIFEIMIKIIKNFNLPVLRHFKKRYLILLLQNKAVLNLLLKYQLSKIIENSSDEIFL